MKTASDSSGCKRRPKSPAVRIRFIPLTTVLLSTFALNLHAQTGSEDYSIVTTWLGQGNASVNGSQALQNNSCVPTATANGLAYLDAYQLAVEGLSPFTVSPDTYTAVNALQSQMGTTINGTTTSGQMNGLQNYLSSPNGANKNPTPSVSLGGQVAAYERTGPLTGYFGGGLNAGVSLQTANPNAQFLANALNANAGVQMGIAWGAVSGGNFTALGGHEVSVVSINMNGGTGTIGILDPWGNGVGNNAGSTGVMELLSVSTVTITGFGSFLEVTYPLTVSGPDDVTSDNGTTAFGGNGQVGIVIDDAIEAVPEPTTFTLLGIGAIGLGSRRFFRRTK